MHRIICIKREKQREREIYFQFFSKVGFFPAPFTNINWRVFPPKSLETNLPSSTASKTKMPSVFFIRKTNAKWPWTGCLEHQVFPSPLGGVDTRYPRNQFDFIWDDDTLFITAVRSAWWSDISAEKGGFQHFWDQNPDQKISQGYFQHLACVSRLNMLKQPTYHQPLAQYFIFLWDQPIRWWILGEMWKKGWTNMVFFTNLRFSKGGATCMTTKNWGVQIWG